MFGLRSLYRRWKFVGACGALFFIVGLLFAVLRPASYMASTQLLVYVRELQPGPEPVISQGRADLAQVQNEIEIIRSHGVLVKVARLLKLADDEEFVPVATPLRMVAERFLRGRKAAFEESRIKQDVAVESLAKHLAVTRVGTSHTILVSVITSDAHKSERIANTIGHVVLQARPSAELEGSRSPLLRERLQGLGPNAYVMTAAVAPDRPSGPRKLVVILGFTMVGIAVGSALVLLQDFTNHTIRSAAQVEYLGLECIGAIPLLRRWRSKSAGPLMAGHELAESNEFRHDAMLDQTVRRATVAIEAAKARTIGVTSAVAGEGAATVAKQLAQAAASCRRKVLLVLVNRNEPSRSFKAQENVKSESVPERPQSRGSIVRDERIGLDVLETDSLDGIDGAAWWMHYDQNHVGAYDFIVLSLPPLEQGPEFRIAAKKLDGILLVLKWGGTELERIERAIAVSGVAPSEFIGAVLNMVDERMIGKFGDRLWKAEAALVAQRRPFKPSMLAERSIG
jgi:capsular polysaccharide biosynthesis protein